MKHTTQRNVMCPYCQKRFKSKATCRNHIHNIHKSEWIKQFKEQIKSGKIQLEGLPNEPNESVLLNITTSTMDNIETRNTVHEDSLYPSIENAQESNGPMFLTNLVQENSIIDSDNQFEYFLLLPTHPETSESGTVPEIATDTGQFVVNDESLSFSNLHFIQLEQPSLSDIQPNSCSTHLQSNCQLNAFLPADIPAPLPPPHDIDLNTDCELTLTSNVGVPNFDETHVNPCTAFQSNQISPKKDKTSTSSRIRKSTKSINKCEICSKIFQKPIDLRRHIRTHTLEKVNYNRFLISL